MAKLLLSNQFKEKIIAAAGGVGIYLRGFALVEDINDKFDKLSDDELAVLTITYLRENTNLIVNPFAKDNDILNSAWPLTYMPAIEYKPAIGMYELHYNAGLQYQPAQSIKEKTISAIAIIGQSVNETENYIQAKNKSYLAGFIILEEAEKSLTDSDSYIFNINVLLSDEGILSLELDNKLFESVYSYGNGLDSTTNQLSGSQFIAPIKDKKYLSFMPDTVKNLNNFINLLAPSDTINNIMSTKSPVSIWTKNGDAQPQMLLSIGGVVDNTFVSSEIEISVIDNKIKIFPTTETKNTRANIFPRGIRTDKGNNILHDDAISMSGNGIGIFSTSIVGGSYAASVDLNSNYNRYPNPTSVLSIDSKNNNVGITTPSIGAFKNTALLKSQNIDSVKNDTDYVLDYDNSYIASTGVMVNTSSAPSPNNTFIGVNGASVHNYKDSTHTISGLEASGESLIIGPNTKSVLHMHQHNVMVGFKGLYGHGKDHYIFGNHNSNFTCPACSGEGKIKNSEGIDIVCEKCNGIGSKTPLFAIGNGNYYGTETGSGYLENFAALDAKDFLSRQDGQRSNVFAVDTNMFIENVHYRLADKVNGVTPADTYNTSANAAMVSIQEQIPANGTGYSLKPCYYTKGYIAFPKNEHNEVYRIDHLQLFNLKNGMYDMPNTAGSTGIYSKKAELDAKRATWFKGIKNFVVDFKRVGAQEVFGLNDIRNAVLNKYGKDLHRTDHFIDTSIPSNIFVKNIGKTDIYIKGMSWFKNSTETTKYEQVKGLRSGESLRVIYRKGFGYDWEGILNFKYSFKNSTADGWVTFIPPNELQTD